MAKQLFALSFQRQEKTKTWRSRKRQSEEEGRARYGENRKGVKREEKIGDAHYRSRLVRGEFYDISANDFRKKIVLLIR